MSHDSFHVSIQNKSTIFAILTILKMQSVIKINSSKHTKIKMNIKTKSNPVIKSS